LLFQVLSCGGDINGRETSWLILILLAFSKKNVMD
jgi:hypothetical protein